MSDFWSHIAPMAYLLMVLAQFGVFLKFVYRAYRNHELQRAFVKDMATNHLPHIYEQLHMICEKFDLESKLPPPIAWVKINGNGNGNGNGHK